MPPSLHADRTSTSQPQQKLRLFVGLAVVGFVWMMVLPRAAKLPAVENRIDWLESNRINPSAMFYTELEQVDELLGVQQSRDVPAQMNSSRSK